MEGNKKKPGKNITKIIVNGREHDYNEKKISYEEVIVIAFGAIDTRPNVAYTVKYSKGNNGKHVDKGSLVQGDTVKVKEGMIFNVSRTDRS